MPAGRTGRTIRPVSLVGSVAALRWPARCKLTFSSARNTPQATWAKEVSTPADETDDIVSGEKSSGLFTANHFRTRTSACAQAPSRGAIQPLTGEHML
jgi:hypothetical protein